MAKSPEHWMAMAIEISKKGLPAPNPHVGCLIVQGDTVVGQGWHVSAGDLHAEGMALQEAGERARGADVYVTLEPCNHYGRRPPCSLALIEAGVRSVTFSCADINPEASGGGKRLQEAGIIVAAGLMEKEAAEANPLFLLSHSLGRPVVCLKAAITLDGYMARQDGLSKWITGESARLAGQHLRTEMGAVLVGRKTVEADDPALTARFEGVKNQPVRVILDPESRLKGTERVFQQPGSTLWIVQRENVRHAGQTPIEAQDGSILNPLMKHLWKEGVRGILVEGGATTIHSFANAGLADRLELFIAPKLFGSGASLWEGWPSTLQLELKASTQWDDDVQLSYKLAGPNVNIS